MDRGKRYAKNDTKEKLPGPKMEIHQYRADLGGVSIASR